MSSKAICYVTDIGFLFPSIASIKSAFPFYRAHDASVYLFVIDVAEDIAAAVAKELADCRVEVVRMDSAMFSGFDRADFNQTHVPLATLGRFFVDPLLPDSIREVIYVDGDTLINGDIGALLETIVPEGRFLAAEDISSFCRNDLTAYGDSVRAYFADIGIGDAMGYFNAGVFKADRRTWRTIGEEAYAFFTANAARCRFHDQSALNATVRDRRLILSTKYNFQTPYLPWFVERSVAPVLYHFTQFPKPWMGQCPPWGRFHDRYQALEDLRVRLALPAKKQDASEIRLRFKEHRAQLIKLYGPLLPRLLSRRRRFLELERAAFLS